MEMSDLLKLSVARKASDLYITPGLPPILRIGGNLVTQDFPVLTPEISKELIYSIMNKDQQRAFEKMLELDFAVSAPDESSFRVSAFHQVHGVAAILRVIPAIIPTLESLETPPVFKQLLNLSSGLILVAGPTGCGKSTTLAAMVNYINSEQSRHVITIEDPVEFTHLSKKSVINQRQVHRDTTGFSNALRSALREDPNVILVGEMRDLETIRLTLTAAETGHLVMATLHTSSAPRAISRIIDVFPAGEKNIIRNLISESLQAVICQTLVNRLDGGRIAAYEIMIGTTAIRNLIRDDKITQMYSVMQTSSQKGMCLMEQYLQELVAKNIISPEAAHESGFQRELFENKNAP